MIGIIGAMDIEIDGLRAKMTETDTRVISGIKFTSGLLGGTKVVTAVCGIGKVFAALCTQTMILNYSPDCIINTGVGGSLTTALNIGSIAIANSAVEHDMDTTALGDEPGYINGLGIVKIPADSVLTEKLCTAAQNLNIPYLTGTIASGDQFVSTIEEKVALAEKFGAITCEMEGAAIGHVCYVNEVPFTIVRAISDSLTDGSGMEYEKFKVMAAEMSNKLVMDVLKLI